MKKHKQLLIFFMFMLLFVQSSLYFSSSQFLSGFKMGEGGSSSREREKNASIIVSLAVKDTKLPWHKEKRGTSLITDLFQSPSYSGQSLEEKTKGRIEKPDFGRQEKYGLSESLRAPPKTAYA